MASFSPFHFWFWVLVASNWCTVANTCPLWRPVCVCAYVLPCFHILLGLSPLWCTPQSDYSVSCSNRGPSSPIETVNWHVSCKSLWAAMPAPQLWSAARQLHTMRQRPSRLCCLDRGKVGPHLTGGGSRDGKPDLTWGGQKQIFSGSAPVAWEYYHHLLAPPSFVVTTKKSSFVCLWADLFS